MKKGLILDLPLSEYQRRLNQLIQQMDKEDLVAVIFTSDENTYYFSGFRSIVWASKVSTPGVLVIKKNGDMAICTSKSGKATAKATSCVETSGITVRIASTRPMRNPSRAFSRKPV